MRESPVSRIVGRFDNNPKKQEDRKKQMLQAYENAFDTQNFPELKGKEREKKPEEVYIIDLANGLSNRIWEDYGHRELALNIPEQNVHIIRDRAWPLERPRSKRRHAAEDVVYKVSKGALFIKENPRLVFARNTLRGMVMMKMYTAAQKPMHEDLHHAVYRNGLLVIQRDGTTSQFMHFNNALIEELVDRHFSKMTKDPVFDNERQATQEILDLFADRTDPRGRVLGEQRGVYYARIKTEKQPTDKSTLIVERSAFLAEREVLRRFVKKIFDANQTKFNNREQVFRMFVDAAMTGNMLPLGRLVEKTFGPGTFQQLGKLDASLAKLEKYVDTLMPVAGPTSLP